MVPAFGARTATISEDWPPQFAVSSSHDATLSPFVAVLFVFSLRGRAMTKSSSIWDTALRSFRPLIIAQGEVAYAYNILQEMFFGVFNLVMALERPATPIRTYYPHALSIWSVLQNDRTQRDLALTALETLPTTLDTKEKSRA